MNIIETIIHFWWVWIILFCGCGYMIWIRIRESKAGKIRLDFFDLTLFTLILAIFFVSLTFLLIVLMGILSS